MCSVNKHEASSMRVADITDTCAHMCVFKQILMLSYIFQFRMNMY